MAAPLEAPEAQPASMAVAADDATASDIVRADAVKGIFSYDQGTLTANEGIAGVFAKAAAALCTAMPAA